MDEHPWMVQHRIGRLDGAATARGKEYRPATHEDDVAYRFAPRVALIQHAFWAGFKRGAREARS